MNALLAHLWSSTLFLLLALAIARLTRRRLTAGARFALVFLGILKFAFPAALFAPLARLLTTASATPLATPLRLLGGALPVDVASSTPALWPNVVAAAWLLTAAALVVHFALVRRRLVALAVRTAMPAHPREVEALARARKRLGIRRSIDVARSALPEAPAVLRVVRPIVVLPASGCDDLSDDELESLLRHECAHVARHDNLLAQIESFICALFWFHPLIWMAQRITAIERERACDEMVAASENERDTYLAALAKFCHAAIVPRLPGVSCMATANLKERMDHIMTSLHLHSRAVRTARVTLAAAAALVVFTAASGIVGSRALAAAKIDPSFSIRVEATPADESGYVTIHATVTDVKTQQVVTEPRIKLALGTTGTISYPGFEATFLPTAAAGKGIMVDVTIRRDGEIVQTAKLLAAQAEATAPKGKFTGDPITLDLRDADLRDVIRTFGKLTGFEMRIDDAVEGKITVAWHNVPWDEAFDSLMNENGLAYHVEGKTITIAPRARP